MNWKEKYLKEPVDGWSFPPDFLREMTHAINDESNESIEMEELEAVLLHLLKLDSSHPEQGEQGEPYRWLTWNNQERRLYVLDWLAKQEEFTSRNITDERSIFYHVAPNTYAHLIERFFREESGKLSSPPPEGQDELWEQVINHIEDASDYNWERLKSEFTLIKK